jgi:hypothetical protein
MLWLTAALFYGVFLWVNANRNSPDNYTNRFNDPRYCCVYHVQAQAYCYIRTDCIPEPQPSDLTTNGLTLLQWAYNLILIVLLGLDVGIVFLIVKPTYDELELEEIKNASVGEALLEQAPPPRRTRTYKGRPK